MSDDAAEHSVLADEASLDHPGGCDQIYTHLLAYLDSEMTEHDAALMRAHLQTCSPCLAELSMEEIIRRLVRRSCAERAPESLRIRVLAQVQTGEIN